MLTKSDLEILAEMRLADANVLLQAGKPSSAYYLAGYSVELGLKACIAKSFQPNVIPDKSFVNAVYTHNVDHLLNAAGLLPQFKSDGASDPQLAASWAIVSNWSESSRYQLWDAVSAGTLIVAVGDSNHGVLQWLKKFW